VIKYTSIDLLWLASFICMFIAGLIDHKFGFIGMAILSIGTMIKYGELKGLRRMKDV